MKVCATTAVSLWSAIMLLAACATSTEPVLLQARSDALPEPLTSTLGDPARGREIVVGRDANCLFCHAIPETGERFMGNVAPPLSGVANRLSAGQLRLRVVDPTRINPEAAMPAYHRTEGLDRVAEPYRGKPILSAQEVEDVVAFLLTLR